MPVLILATIRKYTAYQTILLQSKQETFNKSEHWSRPVDKSCCTQLLYNTVHVPSSDSSWNQTVPSYFPAPFATLDNTFFTPLVPTWLKFGKDIFMVDSNWNIYIRWIYIYHNLNMNLNY